ncbi:hypothetical protein [Streptomyces sp. XD-27]|uniref:hypothetical protein n=1 Tax=Streptomyces sp. XD-27 TaxID=3062779 RepID=UPI0026F41394|nr:hypothetical protein [Streptomyces sp. XD-27]WKX72207.1 hypothetical protein Q3Y56_21955 [Streptomyces sp. XD-27]
MEAEVAALAASGATTLVGLMVSDAWAQGRERLVRFFGRGDGEDSAEEELRASREELVAACEAGDEEAAADIEAGWRQRLRRVLRADPEAAAELRSLLAELDPEPERQSTASVHNSISGGVQHGPVFQGHSFSGITFHGSGTVPPERGAGGARAE